MHRYDCHGRERDRFSMRGNDLYWLVSDSSARLILLAVPRMARGKPQVGSRPKLGASGESDPQIAVEKVGTFCEKSVAPAVSQVGSGKP